jgi:hypothetical protein
MFALSTTEPPIRLSRGARCDAYGALENRKNRTNTEPRTRDPWDNEYNYVQPGKHNPNGFDIFSSGPDRLPNTADDIGNWE